jgi:hypothetical protein
MRTTLDLDDSLVQIARELAQQRKLTIGRVISDLALESLEPKSSAKMRNGVPLFNPRPGARKPSLKLVNELRDEA